MPCEMITLQLGQCGNQSKKYVISLNKSLFLYYYDNITFNIIFKILRKEAFVYNNDFTLILYKLQNLLTFFSIIVKDSAVFICY